MGSPGVKMVPSWAHAAGLLHLDGGILARIWKERELGLADKKGHNGHCMPLQGVRRWEEHEAPGSSDSVWAQTGHAAVSCKLAFMASGHACLLP